MLTETQVKAAQEMRTLRPAVIPGTNVIPDDAQRRAWYKQVTATMERVGISGLSRDIEEFCNIAGVPS